MVIWQGDRDSRNPHSEEKEKKEKKNELDVNQTHRKTPHGNNIGTLFAGIT